MIKSFNVPTVSISEVLSLEGKHYDFFRKIFDKDFVDTISTLVVFIPLSQNKINIAINIYLKKNLLYLFNPRAPPFFS